MLPFFANDNLGLRQNLPVFSWQSIADEYFLNQLYLIDWEAILIRLIKSDESCKLTLAQVFLTIHKYGLFLLLIRKYPSVRMVPTQEIDAILHAHLANINQFENDCKKLFNASLLHIPDFGKAGDAEKREWQLAFAQTKRLFEHHFGQGSMGSSTAACCEILVNYM